MEDIYALLNINQGVLRDFPLQAERLVDHQTELAINRCVRSLKEIEENVMSDRSVAVSPQSIDEVMLKVIENAKLNNRDYSIWSVRELRIVSYYLMKLQGNEDAYKYALSLLNDNWRDLFFNGLSFYCLDSWNAIDPELRVHTCNLLRNKLQLYKEKNKKYLAMKNHANLFDEAGPYRLSVTISQKKQEITEAPSYFNNKQSTLIQSYYSDVIVKFCESNKVMDLDYIEKIFEVHNLNRTKKLVLADLVERLNNYGDEIQRTMLCKFVNRVLGDITLASTWAPFSGATEKDAQKLRNAKQLVNLWFNQKIIETFFERCVQDRDRKKFWLDYVEKLSGFRIIGSTVTKRMLESDERVSGIFHPYFIETDSYAAQTSALVLFIKNKMLVEFSDTGALYAYNLDHKIVNLVIKRSRFIRSTSELKQPSMNNLVITSDWGPSTYCDEGRMTHIGRWQDRLSEWLQRRVFSSANMGMSIFDSADNEVFKAKPVEKESFKATPVSQPIKAEPNIVVNSTSSSPKEDRRISNLSTQRVAESHAQQRPESSSAKLPFEYNIPVSISSKWFYEDRYRIVGSFKGYYIHFARNNKYFKIINTLVSKPTGGIWIKRADSSGWMQVVHASSISKTIGYVKEIRGELMFKRDQNSTDIMTIK